MVDPGGGVLRAILVVTASGVRYHAAIVLDPANRDTCGPLNKEAVNVWRRLIAMARWWDGPLECQ